jgi:hypothetical protein
MHLIFSGSKGFSLCFNNKHIMFQSLVSTKLRKVTAQHEWPWSTQQELHLHVSVAGDTLRVPDVCAFFVNVASSIVLHVHIASVNMLLCCM